MFLRLRTVSTFASSRVVTSNNINKQEQRRLRPKHQIYLLNVLKLKCEYVFGIPGEENLDFLDSLSRSKKIKLVLTRHEQGAKYGFCLRSSNGQNRCLCFDPRTRATNHHRSGLCWLGGMPMLMITGQNRSKNLNKVVSKFLTSSK